MSQTFEVSELTNLIQNYLNGKKLERENARLGLASKVIDGEDLIIALSDLSLQEIEEYQKIKKYLKDYKIEDSLEEVLEDYVKIKEDLENLTMGKTGKFVNQIKQIIKEHYNNTSQSQ